MPEAIVELFGSLSLQSQTAANTAGDGQQVDFLQATGQAMITGQDDGEDGPAVEVGAGKQA